jgi:peptidoglycan/xylan/chitin deacetylase (PgdA/CDA1 family)
MYHDVVSGDPDESGFPGPGPGRYKLPWTTFVEHLDRIAEAAGGPPAVVDDLITGRLRSSSWLLTFDDAGTSAMAIAVELASRGWRGHFFASTNLIGRPGFLDREAIREVKDMGHVIGSHSVSHPMQMSSLPSAELLREWRESVAVLSDLLGTEVRSASVPGGSFARRVALAAEEAGIAALFTSEPVRTARRIGACLVIGRFTVRRSTSARDAARAAEGEAALWAAQYAAWNLRKPMKALGAERYDRIRRALLAGRRRRPTNTRR